MTKKIVMILIAFVAIGAAVLFFMNRSGSTATTQGETWTITDAAERKVSFHIPTTKVIPLTNADTETMYALGVKPLGMVTNFNMSDQLAKELADVPKVGAVTAPNLEKIVALKPDLVVASMVPFQLQMVPSFEKAGIPTVVFKANSYQDILERIRFFGKVLHKEDKAKEIIAGIESKVKAEKQKYAAHPKKKVLIVWGTTASFQLASSKTFVGDIVAQVPVENLADQFTAQMNKKGLGSGFVALDMEYLAKTDVDAILIVTHGAKRENAKHFIDAFRSQPAWQNLKAVREGHVYDLPSEMFAANPNVRVADSVAYIGKLLYGEK